MSLRSFKFLSIFLGVLMFAFGFLKFFEPFHGWFDAQIHLSHLPEQSILIGKISEMVTGSLFLLPWIKNLMSERVKALAVLAASASLVVQMMTAIYVHLNPQVPASVLPLGIKPPFIPGVVLILALLAGHAAWQKAMAKGNRSTGSMSVPCPQAGL